MSVVLARDLPRLVALTDAADRLLGAIARSRANATAFPGGRIGHDLARTIYRATFSLRTWRDAQAWLSRLRGPEQLDLVRQQRPLVTAVTKFRRSAHQIVDEFCDLLRAEAVIADARNAAACEVAPKAAQP